MESSKLGVLFSPSNPSMGKEANMVSHNTFQCIFIGSVAFLSPGLWNAMFSLRAEGEETPFLVSAANALVFGLSHVVLFKPLSEITNRCLKWEYFACLAGRLQIELA